MKHVWILATVVLGACGPPEVAIYGPRSGDGVALESIHARTRTPGLWQSACWLESAFANRTGRAQEIELRADVVLAENKGLSDEKQSVRHAISATVTVAPHHRVVHAIQIPARTCDKLMYVDVQSLTSHGPGSDSGSAP